MNNKRLVDQINGLRLTGLEDLKMGDALRIEIEVNDIFRSSQSVLRSILRILKYVCIRSVTMEPGRNGIVFYNGAAERKDLDRCFEAVVSCAANPVVIMNRKNMHFSGAFRRIQISVKWYRALRTVTTKRYGLFLASLLTRVYIDYSYLIDRIATMNPALLVVLTDLNLRECMLVQKCKLLGIPTATLQHGVYNKRDYEYSRADYFLGIGKSTIDDAKRYGVCTDRIHAVGLMQLIDERIRVQPAKSGKRIAAVLMGAEYAHWDIEMMDLLFDYIRDNPLWSVIVKPHPGYGIERYAYDRWGEAERVITEEMPINDLADLVDVAVMGGTTVYMEMTVALLPTLFYSGYPDYYQGVTWGKFKTLDELSELLKTVSDHCEEVREIMDRSRHYLTEIDHVRDNYTDFFKRFEC